MDRDSIELVTPEGLTLELTLAGLGSRSIAAILDSLIQLVILVVVRVVAPASPAGLVFIVAASLALMFGYPLYFETRGGGASPGKRAVHLKVVRADGGPVGFVASFTRTVLRIVDILPGTYAVGLVSIFVTTHNQRLGDLAAGTIVIREATSQGDIALPPIPRPLRERIPDELDHWDTTAISPQELAVVRSFLGRRGELGPATRAHLARNLAAALGPKVVRPPGDLDDEALLARIAASKARADN